MPTIELWEQTGKGVIRFVHNLKRPVEIVALEDVNRNLYPIYEGNNEVPAGIYGIVIIRPYAQEDSEVYNRSSIARVEVWNEDDIVHIVNVGTFLGGYIPKSGNVWEKYVNANAEKLERPVGWLSRNAQRMILDANKRT